MHATTTLRAAPTCVWMDAGVLNFKLCDRDYDCDHCPLNAALHGSDPVAERDRRDQSARDTRTISPRGATVGPR